MSKKTEHEHYVEQYAKYRLDINDPANGYGGSNVFKQYAWTDQDEKACIAYDENGKLKFHADKDIEIIAGALLKANLDVRPEFQGEVKQVIDCPET